MDRMPAVIRENRKALILSLIGTLVGALLGAVAGYFLGSTVLGALVFSVIALYVTTSNTDWMTKADPRTRGLGSGGGGPGA